LKKASVLDVIFVILIVPKTMIALQSTTTKFAPNFYITVRGYETPGELQELGFTDAYEGCNQ